MQPLDRSLSIDFEAIDRRIEARQERLESCRQGMALSRAAVAVSLGVLVLVLTLATSYRTPTVVFSAFAALVGGTVWLGASRTSLRETLDELADLDAEKSRMIDRVAARNGWRDMTPTVH